MRKLFMICFVAVLCGGLAFAKQRKNTPSAQGSVERNEATVRRIFDDLWTGRRYGIIDSVYERNCVVHYNARTLSLNQWIATGQGWQAAFPDMVVSVNRITGNENIVEINWIAQGTNTGPGQGLPGRGKRATAHGTNRFRFNANGKIAEEWVDWDENGLRRQVAGR